MKERISKTLISAPDPFEEARKVMIAAGEELAATSTETVSQMPPEKKDALLHALILREFQRAIKE